MITRKSVFARIAVAILLLAGGMCAWADSSAKNPQTASKASAGCCGGSDNSGGGTASGCGDGGSSCGAAKPASSQVVFTVAQQKKLSAIDAMLKAKMDGLQKKFDQKQNELSKLIDNPKSSDAIITAKMHELGIMQADMELAQVFADRAKDKIYTPQQKVALKNESSASCGCGGGGSGGCGSGGGCGG